jgi:hypothetical protein
MFNLNKILKGEHILGQTRKNRICSVYQVGKQVGAPHPIKNVLITTRPLELLHMDIFGPVAYISIGVFRDVQVYVPRSGSLNAVGR